MKQLLLFKVAGLALILGACQPENKQQDSAEVAKDQNDAVIDNRDEEKDADFIVNSIASNYAEIKLAQLALTKSTDGEVKEMATQLEKDHTKVLKELQGYAAKNGISVPTQETNEAMEDRGDLAEKDAADFDEEWCEMVQRNHENTIENYESRIDKTEDMELKNWITNTLPGLRTHLQMLDKHEGKHEGGQ